MSNNVVLVGLGNRARNGKDSAADYIAQNYSNIHIVHFADALKLEARNVARKDFLMYFEDGYYYILDYYNKYDDACYVRYTPSEVPYLDEIFKKRDITYYAGMEGNGYDEFKDGEILQFWGTDFRRNLFGKNYWVDQTFTSISEISKSYTEDEYCVVLLPDTRFINEYNEIKFYNPYSKYVSVVRYNPDGSRYYDPNRDPNHPSEKEIDNVDYDFIIEAKSGEMNKIYSRCDEIMEKIIKNMEKR